MANPLRTWQIGGEYGVTVERPLVTTKLVAVELSISEQGNADMYGLGSIESTARLGREELDELIEALQAIKAAL